MPAFSLAALIRAFLVWVLIIAAESVHGTLRRLLLDPDTAFALRQVSVVVAVLIVFAVTWMFSRWLAVHSTAALLGVGLLWVILTVAFETVFARALGMGWREIAAGYDLTRGAIMPLGLLATALTPWIVRRLKARASTSGRSPA